MPTGCIFTNDQILDLEIINHVEPTLINFLLGHHNKTQKHDTRTSGVDLPQQINGDRFETKEHKAKIAKKRGHTNH